MKAAFPVVEDLGEHDVAIYADVKTVGPISALDPIPGINDGQQKTQIDRVVRR